MKASKFDDADTISSVLRAKGNLQKLRDLV